MLIAIHSGTTTLAFAAAIAGLPDVCVVTNSVEIARVLLAAGREADVILLGGRVSGDVPGTFGELTLAQMRRFSPDLGVFSPVAANASEGATNFHLVEAKFAKVMVERSRRTVLLADHSKLGITSRVHVCDCSRIDTLMTDRSARKDHLLELSTGGIGDVIVAQIASTVVVKEAAACPVGHHSPPNRSKFTSLFWLMFTEFTVISQMARCLHDRFGRSLVSFRKTGDVDAFRT